MGKQSSTYPMRRTNFTARTGAVGDAVLFAATLGVLLFPAPARPQTIATTLPLLYPYAIVFDPAGNLYFAETGSHVVREVTPAGVITTVAGTGTQGFSGDNGPATLAQLDSPAGLALDPAGNTLYIADTHNHRIRKLWLTTGALTTVAGTGNAAFSGDTGPATSATLNYPTALALDSAANLYVADTGNHRIRRIAAATGVITTVAGNGIQAFSGDSGPATAASIDSPNGIAFDPANNLYLADTHNHRIRRISAATGIITTVAGSTPSLAGLPAFAGDSGPVSSATLALPRGLTVDAAGNLYLADAANHRIRKISNLSGNATINTAAGQGTEAFAGDNGPAVAASLDSPHSVALSPAGLLTLADTGNARIRQLDQLPAPGPDIHTLAGVGITTLGALALTGPSVTAYGSGVLTATLTSSTLATGTVTFLDTAASTTTTIATTSLAANTATLLTNTLPAGAHILTALYPGDGTHPATQSSAFALTITPIGLTASPDSTSVLYGQTIPTLTGTLTGVLPQDTSKVTAIFLTTAAVLSPTGSYAIAANLTGPSAANYTLTTQPAALTISPAPTLTSVSPSSTNVPSGTPVTLTLFAASTTSGTPTGTVTLLDSTAPVVTLPLINAAAAYTTSSLALGSHTLTAAYSGDANFQSSTSTAATLAVLSATPSDFAITPTGATSQSIPSGSAATFSFSVTAQGPALSSPIALALAGVPLGATSSINPAYIPPGGAVTSFTVTIQTPKAALALPPPSRTPAFPPLLAILLLPATIVTRSARRKLRRLSHLALAVSFSILALSATACGNRVNIAAETSTAASYTLTVTGTATSPAGAALQHSANVTLRIL